MSFTAIENNPISINLLTQANYTGWSLNPDGSASHSSCQSGAIKLPNYSLKAGNTYQVSWVASVLSSGYVQLEAPGTTGISRTAPGVYVDTITPNANGIADFFSNGVCTITYFTIANVTNPIGTTIAYSAINEKWSDFRTYYPDFGWSQFENTLTAKDGAIWFHENGSESTNNFYGVQYQSIIKAVFAKNPAIINTYEALSYQANQLLVSTIGGITTPLGQQTTLIDTDFIKQALDDGVSKVTIYQANNVYSASFLNDSNDDTLNGDPMKGNWIAVELVTVDGSTILKLFSMNVRTARTYIGSR